MHQLHCLTGQLILDCLRHLFSVLLPRIDIERVSGGGVIALDGCTAECGANEHASMVGIEELVVPHVDLPMELESWVFLGLRRIGVPHGH